MDRRDLGHVNPLAHAHRGARAVHAAQWRPPPWFALGLALPSELRRKLRAESRDAYPEFVKLLPNPSP
jgi:hypothetical protein